MRISDWSSDVCSSDLQGRVAGVPRMSHRRRLPADLRCRRDNRKGRNDLLHAGWNTQRAFQMSADSKIIPAVSFKTAQTGASAKSDELGMRPMRSEEHTSELQSLMRISYDVFCLKKNITTHK